MEVRVEKPDVPVIPKKSRSVDLQSIHVRKPTGSDRKSLSQKELLGAREIAKALDRKRSSLYDNGGSVLGRLRSKRRRKEVSLSTLGSAIKRHRNSPNTARPKQDGFVFRVGKREKASSSSGASYNLDSNGNARHLGNDLTLRSSKKKKHRVLVDGNSENSSGLVSGIAIPKQPRGITRWKRSEDPISLRRAIPCNNSSAEVQNNESSITIVLKSQVLNARQKKKLNEFKKNGSSRNSPVPHIEGESGSSIQVSGKKDQKQKQQLAMVKETHLENEASLVNNEEPFPGDFQDDDEENLEQNAARMLSSRFDPGCMGFSRDRMAPKTKSVSMSSLLQSGHQNLKDPVMDACPVDFAGRVLRPRKCYGKSFVRKRRHFYEVCSKDMDPHCIIKQRIRVFWPLDKSWYFGLVKDYDPVTRLHHVEYDDRDEEWINLQNERFKLLLFPSELGRKLIYRNTRSEQKQKSRRREEEATDESSIGSFMESEPIISWLARSTRRVKLTPANIIKQGRTNLLKDSEPSISLEMRGNMAARPSDMSSNKLFSKSVVPKRSSDEGIAEVSMLKSKAGFEDIKLSYVYFRKRFHYRKDSLGNMLEQDSARGSSTAPISILSSVADRATGIGLNIIKKSAEVKQVTLKLQLPHQCICELASEAESFWLCHTQLLLQYGKLVLVWPMVHMELTFVDNNRGLRILLFEGSLKWAVSMLCIIVRTFYQHNDWSKFVEPVMPFTSIWFKLSGLHDQGGELLMVLHSFVKLNNSRWKHLEDKLHCIRVKELTVAEITYSSIKNLPSDQIPRTSVFKNLASLEKPNKISSQEHPDNNDQLTVAGCFPVEEPSDQVSKVTHENLGTSLSQAAASSGKQDTDALSASNDGDWMSSSNELLGNEVNVTENSVGREVKNSSYGETIGVCERLQCKIGLWRGDPEDSSSPDKSEGGYNSCMNTTNVRVHLLDQMVKEHSFDKITQAAELASDLLWEVNENACYNENPSAPRSVWHRNCRSSVSHTGHHTELWPEDLMLNFASGSKKPRTQVSYSLLSGGNKHGSKPQINHRKVQPYRKTKNNNAMSSFGCLGNRQNYRESLTCDANVLVTVSDRGWRECGAQVALESNDQQNWKICVKFSGVTKYVHKAHHFLHPGTTNRYTHAMMWKGGSNWNLEFTDRSQWCFFKQIHDECYNRNIKAASVKNIPIPGVHLVADGDDDIVSVPFVCNPSKYFLQVGTEVDMALDPSHVLYDMDSGDEEWVSTTRNPPDSSGGNMSEITEDLFERVMDMFEKFAYAQQCDEFTIDDIEEFMADVAPLDVIIAIYEHWHQKRQKKGLPLIRQFQPALWERYQQQLKERESAMIKMHSSSDGCQDKTCLLKKPPMVAFCLRPRGMQVPNKGSKQRSHKKLMFMGHNNAFAREWDSFHAYSRKWTGPLVGEERPSMDIPSYESLDSFHWLQSPTSFSLMDSARTESLLTNDCSDRFPQLKLNRSNSKKIVMFPSPEDSQIAPFSYNQKSKKTGIHQWGADMHDWPSTKQSQSDGCRNHRADVNDFRLWDASSAAQHASNMAKLKREKAKRLLYEADVALHRALAAVMTAEAIKASEKDLIDDW